MGSCLYLTGLCCICNPRSLTALGKTLSCYILTLLCDKALDPCATTEHHLVFETSGEVFSVNKQGQITIQIFGLNRTRLVRKRKAELRQLQKQLDTLANQQDGAVVDSALLGEVVASAARSSELTAMKRQHLSIWLKARQNTPLAILIADRVSGLLPSASEAITDSGRQRIRHDFAVFQKDQEEYSLREGSNFRKYFV